MSWSCDMFGEPLENDHRRIEEKAGGLAETGGRAGSRLAAVAE